MTKGYQIIAVEIDEGGNLTELERSAVYPIGEEDDRFIVRLGYSDGTNHEIGIVRVVEHGD
jgi:hypothetical protein